MEGRIQESHRNFKEQDITTLIKKDPQRVARALGVDVGRVKRYLRGRLKAKQL